MMKMKKATKKIISCLLSAVMAVGAFSVTVCAASDEKHPTGLIVDDWNTTVDKIYKNNDELYAKMEATVRPGDFNWDGKVTVADARACLRVYAKLESANMYELGAGDMDSNGVINASDARAILRIAARLEKAPALIETTSAKRGCVIGPFSSSISSGYTWKCSADSDKKAEHIKIQEFSVKSEDGLSLRQYFILTPDSYGKYTLNAELTNSETGKVSETAEVIIQQCDSFTVHPGEQVTIDGIYTSGSIMYSWMCTSEPSTGLKIDYTTKEIGKTSEDGKLIIGAPVEQIFTITAEQLGEYTLHFEFTANGVEKALDDFDIKISVVGSEYEAG